MTHKLQHAYQQILYLLRLDIALSLYIDIDLYILLYVYIQLEIVHT